MGSRSHSENEGGEGDYGELCDKFLEKLSEQPEYEEIVSEIGVLRSIYGDDAVRPRIKSIPEGSTNATSEKYIRFEVTMSLPPPHDSPVTNFRVLVSLPHTYPSTNPPQLQLLSRYIGPYSVDPDLFGSILRTYISSVDGVEFVPGLVCVFDGLEFVKEQKCLRWYEERLSEEKVNDLIREDERESTFIPTSSTNKTGGTQEKMTTQDEQVTNMPDGLSLTVSEPIVDRKSVFIGRACRITDPSQVQIILDHLMSDRRIARAAHPIINAWRCKANGILYQDNDDDGETAAGGRLAHLLQLQQTDNVLVVVTRYFGGIHLGPDRFKHINQAARDALELGGFLNTHPEKGKSSRSKKKK